MTTYSDACWGSQIGNAIPHNIAIPLFKFRSMSGAILYRMGGPVSWKAIRQDQTALSSCEAEIFATSEGAKITVGVRNLADGFDMAGNPVCDNLAPTLVYNDNAAAVIWANSTTMKNVRHLELRENRTREWVQNGTITVLHVAGKINPSDIFTKEMKDGAHFRRLRDSFMCRLSDFNRITQQIEFQLRRNP